MTKLIQTCSDTPGYFVFVFSSRLPLGKICHQRQVADSIRFDPILISGNRTEKSLRTHNKRLIVFKSLNINNRQSLICHLASLLPIRLIGSKKIKCIISNATSLKFINQEHRCLYNILSKTLLTTGRIQIGPR